MHMNRLWLPINITDRNPVVCDQESKRYPKRYQGVQEINRGKERVVNRTNGHDYQRNGYTIFMI